MLHTLHTILLKNILHHLVIEKLSQIPQQRAEKSPSYHGAPTLRLLLLLDNPPSLPMNVSLLLRLFFFLSMANA